MNEIVVATGDPQGIGPEVSVAGARRFLERRPEGRVVLVGDPAILARAGWETEGEGGLDLLAVPLPEPLQAPAPSAAGGAAALRNLQAATDHVLQAPGRALVTAPLSKAAVSRVSPGFLGHTGWLGERLGAPHPVMLFVAGDLRVALATVHLPLAEVPRALTTRGLLRTLDALDAWLRRVTGQAEPRIAVLALNPHAGEEGLLGTEEQEVIEPAIRAFKAAGGRATGPHPADGFFGSRGHEDASCVLAMYHDQGLVALKSLAFGGAVNVTVGLPIPRTSVDHGCAYALAGSGTADSTSMLAALEVAADLASAVDR